MIICILEKLGLFSKVIICMLFFVESNSMLALWAMRKQTGLLRKLLMQNLIIVQYLSQILNLFC